ncbi:CDP-glycerol glycerophosphotransferase family protein [Glutamicibacter nicotianae]
MKVLSTVARVTTYAKKRYAAQLHRKFIDKHVSELCATPTGEERYLVALHFADDMVNAYQIRQWYEPLKNLAQYVPVVIIVRHPEAAVALHKECPLPIHYAPTVEKLEQFTESQDLRLVLYVNQNIRNFQMMRFNSPNHVFICHGESDKAYMWSNQLKAYDYVFSAGEAARERLTEHLRNFDVLDRTRLIGRPQIDVQYPTPYEINHDYPTVLYAPTWEGDRPSMAYGSVLSHGEQLVDALINDGGFNIIFRPHPRSGINSRAYGQVLERIRNKFGSSEHFGTVKYIYDESAQWGWQWSAADICITDISAVAYDYLATGKPMFVTEPFSKEATVEDSLALTKLPAMPAKDAANAAELVRTALKSVNKESRELVQHYFGDVTPGASMNRFIKESLNLVNGNTGKKELDGSPGNRNAGSQSAPESVHERKTA